MAHQNTLAEIERYLDEAKNAFHQGDYAELLTLIIMARSVALNARVAAALTEARVS